jgi:protein SCO1
VNGRRSIAPASAILAFLLASACGSTEAESRTAAGAASQPPRDHFSVYALEAAWTDQSGRERRLGSLAGRVQVVAMVYTHCHHTCPQIVTDLKRVEARSDGAGFILVSLDPERDTPAQLQAFAEGLRLDPARWTLLVGTEESTRMLSALLGVRYQAAADREIAHTNQLIVLDGEGAIVHIREGLDEDLDRTVDAIRRASR